MWNVLSISDCFYMRKKSSRFVINTSNSWETCTRIVLKNSTALKAIEFAPGSVRMCALSFQDGPRQVRHIQTWHDGSGVWHNLYARSSPSQIAARKSSFSIVETAFGLFALFFLPPPPLSSIKLTTQKEIGWKFDHFQSRKVSEVDSKALNAKHPMHSARFVAAVCRVHGEINNFNADEFSPELENEGRVYTYTGMYTK